MQHQHSIRGLEPERETCLPLDSGGLGGLS